MLTVEQMFKLVKEAGRDAEPGDVTIRKYSGRGMYGRSCFGLALKRGVSEYGVIAMMVALVEDEDDRLDLAEMFMNTHSDSLGLGTIIYWPSLKWPEGLVEPRDDNDEYADEDEE